jgi:MFS family permease
MDRGSGGTSVWRLDMTRGIRGFAVGGLSVALVLEWARGGLSPLWVGALIGLSVAGGALGAAAAPWGERRFGRKTVWTFGSGLLSLGALVLFVDSTSVPLAALALFAMGVGLSGSDIGVLAPLEQASMADLISPSQRTWHFSIYNLAGYATAALGAVSASLPLSVLGLSIPGLPEVPRGWIPLAAGSAALALIPLYRGVVFPQPAPPKPSRGSPPLVDERLRRPLRELALLFGLDAFAGGLAGNGLIAYWLSLRFAPASGVTSALAGTIGDLLAGTSVAAGLSLLVAAPLARRLGLLRTMVYTHLPSNILLIAFALSPSFSVAAGLLLARFGLSQMDVPTRQSYVQGLVPLEGRSAAAGFTTAARSPSILGPPLSGVLLSAGTVAMGGPFLLAGALKTAYDLILWFRFRRISPLGPPPPEPSGPPEGIR